MFGKEAKKKELIKNLDALYAQLQREHKINAGDFPDLEKMKKDLKRIRLLKVLLEILFNMMPAILIFLRYIYHLLRMDCHILLLGQLATQQSL